jgi:hypothetical protein
MLELDIVAYYTCTRTHALVHVAVLQACHHLRVRRPQPHYYPEFFSHMYRVLWPTLSRPKHTWPLSPLMSPLQVSSTRPSSAPLVCGGAQCAPCAQLASRNTRCQPAPRRPNGRAPRCRDERRPCDDSTNNCALGPASGDHQQARQCAGT